MNKYVIGAVAGIALLFGSGYIGYRLGSQNIIELWNQEKDAYNKALFEYKAEQEKKHIKLQQELIDAEKQYKESVDSINAVWADKLFASQKRANYYRNKANTATGCNDLANTAKRLDTALTEGISLVQELSSYIRLRDDEIKSIGKQINE